MKWEAVLPPAAIGPFEVRVGFVRVSLVHARCSESKLPLTSATRDERGEGFKRAQVPNAARCINVRPLAPMKM
jgi:hypothetical protein